MDDLVYRIQRGPFVNHVTKLNPQLLRPIEFPNHACHSIHDQSEGSQPRSSGDFGPRAAHSVLPDHGQAAEAGKANTTKVE